MSDSRSLALSPDPDWSFFLSHITSQRAELAHPDSDGKYILHHVISSQAPFPVIEKVLQAFPLAATLRTREGHLPLDYALNASPRDAEVVALLTSSMSSSSSLNPTPFSPLAASSSSSVQSTPLHSLCVFRHAAAKSRLSSHPSEASVQDLNGDLPLHILCEHGAPFDVVFEAIKAFPEGAGRSNGKGKGPMHLAAERGDKAADVIRALKAVFGEAIHKRDYEGETPRDKAVKAFASKEVLALLEP